MAADQEVFRKFLVSLGFQINDVEQRKFEKSIESAQKGALTVGKNLLGAASAAQALVAGYGSAMEKLYYLSQRTGSSVENLFSGGQAGKTIGLTAETIQNAVASLARTIREQPGIQGLIEGLGVKVTGRDMSDVLTDVVTQLKSRPFYEAAQYWKALGQDPDTLLAMEQNLDTFVKAQEEYKRVMKEAGLDADASAKKFAEYERSLVALETRFKVLGAVIADKLLPPFKEFTDELTGNLDKLNKWLNDPKQKILEVKRTAPGQGTTGNPATDKAIQGTFMEWLLHGYISDHHAGPGGPEQHASGKVLGVPQKPPGLTSGQTRGRRNNNPGNIEYGAFAREMGATGSDGRFAIFPDMATGSKAMAMLLSRYSQRGIGTVEEVINRWSNPKESVDRNAAYISGVRGALGTKPGEHIDLSNPQTVATLVSAMGRHESGFDPLAGSAPITINQKTEIKIIGVTSPQAAGKAVLDGQDRVNGDLARNMKGAVR